MSLDEQQIDAARIDAMAQGVLRTNDRGGYTIPTDGLYPYQWNWDSAVSSWGWAAFDTRRAWLEIETLMSGQWPNGMVPHILFHHPDPGYFPGPEVWGTEGIGPVDSSGISQPPLAATFVRKIWEKDPVAGEAHARALFPKLKAWHSWFMTWRAEQGAICVNHPWESGRDNAPDWDATMAAIDPEGVGEYVRRDTGHVHPDMRPTKADYDRYIWLVQLCKRLDWDEAAIRKENPFRVADPTMTFILRHANLDLAHMGRALGEDVSEIDSWNDQLAEGAATLWNDELQSYDARDMRTGQFAGCVTSAAFLCWYGGIDDDRMQAQIERVWNAVRYPVPSCDPHSEHFNAKRYWRGPTWAIINTLIGLGLEQQGHLEHARRLRNDTAHLIAKHGFAEYFNPMDGAPAGGGTFSWTAAVWLAWASPTVGRP